MFQGVWSFEVWVFEVWGLRSEVSRSEFSRHPWRGVRLWNWIPTQAHDKYSLHLKFSSVFRDRNVKNSIWIRKMGYVISGVHGSATEFWIQMGYVISGVLGSVTIRTECFRLMQRYAVGCFTKPVLRKSTGTVTVPSLKHKSHQVQYKENLPNEIQHNKTKKISDFIVAWKTLPVWVINSIIVLCLRTQCMQIQKQNTKYFIHISYYMTKKRYLYGWL